MTFEIVRGGSVQARQVFQGIEAYALSLSRYSDLRLWLVMTAESVENNANQCQSHVTGVSLRDAVWWPNLITRMKSSYMTSHAIFLVGFALTKEGKLSYMRIYHNRTPTNYKIPKFYVPFVEKIANQLVDWKDKLVTTIYVCVPCLLTLCQSLSDLKSHISSRVNWVLQWYHGIVVLDSEVTATICIQPISKINR